MSFHEIFRIMVPDQPIRDPRMPCNSSFRLFLCALVPAVSLSVHAQGENGLSRPNWDRTLALQTAAAGVETGTVYQQRNEWFRQLREGEHAALLQSVQAFAASSVLSSPVREQQLFLFTIALADFPAQQVPAQLLEFLARYSPQTLVAHEENDHSAVALFNIPAAAQGVQYALARQQGEARSVALLAAPAERWIRDFLAASPAARAGFLDALDFAPATRLGGLDQVLQAALGDQPALAVVAARTALAVADVASMRAVLEISSGPEATSMLRKAAQSVPRDGRAELLLASIESAPPQNAALAIALLSPGLQDVPQVVSSLFDLLEDPELGSAAALALARFDSTDIRQQLAVQAQDGRIVNWVETAPVEDSHSIALGYPVPLPVDTPLPFDGFRSYAGLHMRHQDLANTTPWVHPVIVGTTRAGRTVWAYRMGDADLLTRAGAAEQAMLTNGGIHAREWQSPETVTGIMELLVQQQDDQFLYRYLLDNANIVLIPVLNVDGFLQTQRFPDSSWLGTDPDDPESSPRDGRMRRKNMLLVDEDLSTQDDHLNGVDLNRNNPPYWNTSPGRSSSDVRSIVHHGAAPQSEPEIQALDAAVQLGPTNMLSMYTDVHSFSQVHFWVKNGNNRLTKLTESLLGTFSNHHAAFPAGKVYQFDAASQVALNRGIGSTDEYFTHTYQVPAWTLEIEPSGNGGADYGGLGRNGHDGFILPESQITRVRAQLAQTFAVAYYRQAGPPSISEFHLIDDASGATVFTAEWDTVPDQQRLLHTWQAQAVQLNRNYTAWIAFDKPMRWQSAGAVAALPGQPPSSLTTENTLLAGNAVLNSTLGTVNWFNTPGGPGQGYKSYINDALSMGLSLPADAANQAAINGSSNVTWKLRSGDMTSTALDTNPATVAHWENGGWSGYENDAGLDQTDSGGSDASIHYEMTSATLGDPFVIEAGTSSAWMDPARNGEGFVLEVLAAHRAVMYWFTYDEEGKQDWYIAVGNIRGNRIAFTELLRVAGGKFGPGFDPGQITETVVGSASFIWSDCDTGEMEWELDASADQPLQQGRMNLQRITRLMGIDCADTVSPPVNETARLSGSWADPSHTGEGYTLELLTDGRALVYWFSFDTNGNRRWFFGVGESSGAGSTITFDEMLTTSGGKFGASFDPADVAILPWGSMELDLGCAAGTATFTPTEPGFAAGALNLERLTSLAGLACP